ncbi:MAG: biopolymer transporter ExbD [Gammaproteobacteria bacterium]|nr:biopolymer transporter ExbD [Gammaproteobacteria bacterium]MDH5651567.1 biopolymer transporter ExbD [Gammaproteobacteria bacterium]
MSRRRIRRSNIPPELNITAFLNLMVILVPFLLMTAVFSHLTILDLNLPTAKDQQPPGSKKPEFDLKVVLRKDEMVVANGSRVVKKIPLRNGRHDFMLLTKVMLTVKGQFADKKAVTILSQQDTPYNDLIQAMDAVRSYHAMDKGEVVEAELFPDISIGDAQG